MFFTGSDKWSLSLEGSDLTLAYGGKKHEARIAQTSPLTISRGIFWTDIRFPRPDGDPIAVDGIPNAHADQIAAAIESVAQAHRVEAEREEQRRRQLSEQTMLTGALDRLIPWRAYVIAETLRHNKERRWITTYSIAQYKSAKPEISFGSSELLDLTRKYKKALGDRYEDAVASVQLWKADLDRHFAERNERFTKEELVACKDLFGRVEKRKLTEEQARAAICFDNRVLVVASAGSGKTSTMVAKGMYALERQLVAPEKILMLAFNNDAAAELQRRIDRAVKSLGWQGVKVEATTFHKLGLRIIAETGGEKKRVPQWASSRYEAQVKLLEIVESLKKGDPVFSKKWDLFRIVFGRDLPRLGDRPDHEDWDRDSRRTGFRTLRGELVKSLEERTIADWCFYNGVNYQYEARYKFDTATVQHSQYHPDFYYPDIDLYHEHFALNGRGEAPPEFVGYLESVKWRRKIHKEKGTAFIETTSAELRAGSAFDKLATELARRGVVLDPNPNRPVTGRRITSYDDLAALLRAFICHAKCNGLSVNELRTKATRFPLENGFRYRWDLFLDLYSAVRSGWDAALRKEKMIDFEDMLNVAANYATRGEWVSPYELVMVDEFQDTSYSRAGLLLSMLKQPTNALFAVGDDWQSVNRFAGADISVMTGFKHWCGEGQLLRLQETFRCPQELCDISSEFIAKNPNQIRKTVRSSVIAARPAIEILRVKDEREVQSAVLRQMDAIRSLAAQERWTRPPSVMVLGRYNQDAQYIPSSLAEALGNDLDVSFSTVHSAKGLEADFVVLPNVVKKGFPSGKEDDPLLLLAMPARDEYPLSEERRLFYVALTRARQSVAIITVEGRESPFVLELVRDRKLECLDIHGQPSYPVICDKCGGVMVEKTGKRGPFLSCSNFPPCRHSRDLPRMTQGRKSHRPRSDAGIRTSEAEWTETEDKALAAAYSCNVPVSDIARQHRRSIEAIRARLEILGLLSSQDEMH